MAKNLETNIAIGGQLDPSLSRVIRSVEKNLGVLSKQAAVANKMSGGAGLSVSGMMGKIGSAASKMGQASKIGFEAVAKGAKLAAVGVAVVATIAASAVAGTYKLANSASNLVESQNVVQQTYKQSSDAILKWTSTVANSAGISQANAMSWVGSMGAMLESSGLGEQASGNMSKSLVQLSGDLSSFYNLSNDDAWQKIRSGISGETEPLKQLGINMSVANLQSEALAEGIRKPWAKMSQAQQTMLRYNYLMKVTSNAQGDFARTLGTSFANQVRVAKLNIETLGNTLGAKFLPSFMSTVQAVNKGFATGNWAEASKGIADGIGGVLSTVASMLPTVISMASTILPGIIGTLVQALPSFASALVNGLLNMVGLLVAQAPTLVPAVMQTVQLLINGMVTGIVTYGPALITAGTQMLTSFVTMLSAAIPQIIPTLINGFSTVITTIATLIPVLLPVVIGALTNILTAAATLLPTVLPIVVNGLQGMIGALVGILPTVLPAVVNGILFILNAAIGVLAEHGPAFLTAALNAVMMLALGLLQAAPKLIPVIVLLIQSVVNWLGKNLSVLVGAGIQAVVQLANGIIEALPQLIAMIPQIITAIVDNLTTNLPLMMNAGVGILTSLITALVTNIPLLLAAVPQIITALANAMISNISLVLTFPLQLIEALGPALLQLDWGKIGYDMLVAIVNGLASAGNLLVGAVNAIFVAPINAALAKMHIPFQIPNIPSIPTIQPPAYASGVVNAPGGLSLVGERGAELINLPRGSTVYNNTETSQILSGMGSIVLQFYITITGGTGKEQEDVQEGVKRALPDIEDVLDAYVSGKRRVAFG